MAENSGRIRWYVNSWNGGSQAIDPNGADSPTRAALNAARYLVVEYTNPPPAGNRLILSLHGTGSWGHTYANATARPATETISVYGDGVSTVFVFDLGETPLIGESVTATATTYGLTINTQNSLGGPAVRAYLANTRQEIDDGSIKVVSITANGSAGAETTTELTITFNKDVPGLTATGFNGRADASAYIQGDITVKDIFWPVRYQDSLVSKGDGVYTLPVTIRQPGLVTVEIEKEDVVSYIGDVLVHVKVDNPPVVAKANLPFPQEGNFEMPGRKFAPSNRTQEQMNADIVEQFKWILKDYVVDPNPGIATDPNAFRMVLRHGTGSGLDGGATRNQVTCSESMGYGMIMLALMAGQDEAYIGNEYARHNLPIVGGKQLTIKDCFDGMYRSLDHFRSAHTSNLPTAQRPSHLMAWELIWRPNQEYFRTPGATGSNTTGGTTSATDGDLDMAYALLLADKQWGSDGLYNYRQKAINMINHMWLTCVNRNASGTSAPTFHFTFGDWANIGSSNGTRPSDFLFSHLKVFKAVAEEAGLTDNNWQAVINVSYDAARQLVAYQNPVTGLIPDFTTVTRTAGANFGRWAIPTGRVLENAYTDRIYNENSTRIPWRYSTDVLLNGEALIPNASPGTPAYETADKVNFSDVVIKPLNNFGATSSGNDPSKIYFGYTLDGRPKITDTGWQGDDRGQGDPSFSSPFLVSAAAYGPQEWMDNGWAYARSHRKTVNYFAEYINMISMITASGNYWDPVLIDQTTSAGSFDIVADVLEWGTAVTAVIIEVDKEVTQAEVDAMDFAVSARTVMPRNNAVIYNGPRTITKAYASAANEKGKPAASGKYIVLELKYGYNATNPQVDGCAAINYVSQNFFLDLDYTVTINGAEAEFNELVRPIYDDFKLVPNPVEGFESQSYRMYTPANSEGKALPLVIFNHGAGETYNATAGGNEGSQLFANMGGVGWVKNAPEDAYFLVPQRGTGVGAPGYSRPGVIAFIEDLVAKGLVDGDRIYVSGASAGGQETHNYLREYRLLIAAAIPICPAGTLTLPQVEPFKHVPVWYVHGNTDRSTQPSTSLIPYNFLLSLGARDARRTNFPSVMTANGERSVFGTELPNPDYLGTDGLPLALYPDGHWSWVMLLNNVFVADAGIPGSTVGSTFMDWLFAQVRLDLFTVTFADGEAVISTAEVSDGFKVAKPADPVKQYYIFDGWYLGDDEFDFDTLIVKDITLQAKWKPVPVSALRIADAKGAVSAAMVSVTRNSTVQFKVIVNADALPLGIVWSTSNSAFASVSDAGVVTVKSLAGTVTLTATAPSGVTHSVVLRIT